MVDCAPATSRHGTRLRRSRRARRWAGRAVLQTSAVHRAAPVARAARTHARRKELSPQLEDRSYEFAAPGKASPPYHLSCNRRGGIARIFDEDCECTDQYAVDLARRSPARRTPGDAHRDEGRIAASGAHNATPTR